MCQLIEIWTSKNDNINMNQDSDNMISAKCCWESVEKWLSLKLGFVQACKMRSVNVKMKF